VSSHRDAVAVILRRAAAEGEGEHVHAVRHRDLHGRGGATGYAVYATAYPVFPA
jgi:hypothetical protein